MKRLLPLCVLLAACAPKFAWPELRLGPTPGGDKFVGASRAVLDARDTLSFTQRGTQISARLVRYRRVKVYTAAATNPGEIVLPFSAKMKLVQFDARAAVPDEAGRQRIEKAALGDLVIHRPLADRGVTEVGEVRFVVPNVVPGSIIDSFAEYEIPDARTLEPLVLRDRLPVERAEVLVVTPKDADFDLRFIENGQSKPMAPLPANAPSSKEVAYRYVLTGLSPLIPEEGGPAPTRIGPAVWPVYRGMRGNDAAPRMASWDDVLGWVREQRSLMSAMGGELDTVKLQAAFAQAALGLEVDDLGLRAGERKFGTGNDRVAAGLRLYDALVTEGFKLAPALVTRDTAGFVLPDVPSPAMFDAIVVAAAGPGKTYYLDPACPACSLEQVSQALEGANVVALFSDGVRLETLPVRDAKDNAFAVTLSTKLGTKGEVVGSGQAILSGFPAASVRTAFRKKDDALLARELGLSDGGKLSNPQSESAGSPGQTFDVQFDVATACKEESPAKFRCGVFDYLQPAMTEVWRESRTQDLQLGRAFQHQLVTTYEIPTRARVEPPQPMTAKSQFGDYSLSFAAEPGRLSVTRRFSVTTRRIPAEDYEELYAFLARVRQFDGVGALVELFAEEPPAEVAPAAAEPKAKKKKR